MTHVKSNYLTPHRYKSMIEEKRKREKLPQQETPSPSPDQPHPQEKELQNEINSTLQELDSIITQYSNDIQAMPIQTWDATPTKFENFPGAKVEPETTPSIDSVDTTVAVSSTIVTTASSDSSKELKVPPAVGKKPARNKSAGQLEKKKPEKEELLLDSLSEEEEELQVPEDVAMETRDSSIMRSNSALSPRDCNSKDKFTYKSRREKVRSVGDNMDIKVSLNERGDENELTKAVSPDELYVLNYHLRHSNSRLVE